MSERVKSFEVHFTSESRGRKRLKHGAQENLQVFTGRVCRLSRLMALAIHFQSLLEQAAVTNQAQLAELGYVSRARITQIMNLNLLAPDIQEQILFLAPVTGGTDVLCERRIRAVAKVIDWDKQRALWREMLENGD